MERTLKVSIIASFLIMILLLVPLIPSSLAATCPPSMTQVDASESPEHDENQNGLICQYVREGATLTISVYQDDLM